MLRLLVICQMEDTTNVSRLVKFNAEKASRNNAISLIVISNNNSAYIQQQIEFILRFYTLKSAKVCNRLQRFTNQQCWTNRRIQMPDEALQEHCGRQNTEVAISTCIDTHKNYLSICHRNYNNLIYFYLY